MMLLSDNFWWLPWTAVVVRNIIKVSHQYVPHAYFSTSILPAMKHSIISVLWVKLKLGHCPTLVCYPTARGQATASSVNTLLWRAPTPPDGVKVNLRWQPWSAKKLSDKCELLQCEDVSKWRPLHHFWLSLAPDEKLAPFSLRLLRWKWWNRIANIWCYFFSDTARIKLMFPSPQRWNGIAKVRTSMTKCSAIQWCMDDSNQCFWILPN